MDRTGRPYHVPCTIEDRFGTIDDDELLGTTMYVWQDLLLSASMMSWSFVNPAASPHARQLILMSGTTAQPWRWDSPGLGVLLEYGGINPPHLPSGDDDRDPWNLWNVLCRYPIQRTMCCHPSWIPSCHGPSHTRQEPASLAKRSCSTWHAGAGAAGAEAPACVAQLCVLSQWPQPFNHGLRR